MNITRRRAIGIPASTASAAGVEQQQAQSDGSVTIGWLGGAVPGADVGISWGVPWARGILETAQSTAA